MLALAHPAEAKIVYTKTHQVIGTNDLYKLDLNHDRIIDFVLRNRGTQTFDYNALRVRGVPGNEAPGNAVEGSFARGARLAAALERGARIGRSQRFLTSSGYGEIMVLSSCTDTSCGTLGQWRNVTNRYLGLRFKVHGKTHYGWARLSVKVKSFAGITATLTGYAYESIPNKPIITGKTKGPDVITLEPGSLGRLAQGSAGRLRK